MGDRKNRGFFFTLAAFIILIYIAASLAMFVSSVSFYEARFAEKFKVSNIELFISNFDQQKLEGFGKTALHRALMRTAEYAAENEGVRSGGSSGEQNEFRYLDSSIIGLVQNGTSDGYNFKGKTAGTTPAGIIYGDDEKAAYTLNGWADTINKSIAKSGFTMSGFEAKGFNVEQTGPNEVKMGYTIVLRVDDAKNVISLDREYKIEFTLDLNGTVYDPALLRETLGNSADYPELGDLSIHRILYFGDAGANDIQPVVKSAPGAYGGQGWFYGPVVMTSEADTVPEAERQLFILAGEFQDIRGTTEYEDFGAYIVTNEPATMAPKCGQIRNEEDQTFNMINYETSTEDGKCEPVGTLQQPTGKPFIVYKDFNMDSMTVPCTYLPDKERGTRCLLFVTGKTSEEVTEDPVRKKSANVKIYDIEKLREAANCQYYVNNENAPSYFQRFFSDWKDRSSEYGIEGFEIGEWTNQKSGNDGFSKADTEFFGKESGTKIKGMPGCKSAVQCSDTESTIGHFSLNNEKEGRAYDYLGDAREDLVCQGTGCEK
ncbi:MAG: hypothetical protein ACP5NX_03030 [Candidatus Bilamarchaeaceae archaeon]